MGVTFSIPLGLRGFARFGFCFAAAVLVALGFDAVVVVVAAEDFAGAKRALQPLKTLDAAKDIWVLLSSVSLLRACGFASLTLSSST